VLLVWERGGSAAATQRRHPRNRPLGTTHRRGRAVGIRAMSPGDSPRRDHDLHRQPDPSFSSSASSSSPRRAPSAEVLTSRDHELGRLAPGGGGARGASRLGARRSRRGGGTPTSAGSTPGPVTEEMEGPGDPVVVPCANCGGGVWSTQKFCGDCGTRLATSPGDAKGGGGEDGQGTPQATQNARGTVDADEGSDSPSSALVFVDSGDRDAALTFGGGAGKKAAYLEPWRVANQLTNPKASRPKSPGKPLSPGKPSGPRSPNIPSGGGGDGGDSDDGGGGGGDGGGDAEESLLDEERVRLLYICKQYTMDDDVAGKKDRWIRTQPLLVLIYEGILNGRAFPMYVFCWHLHPLVPETT